MHFCMHPEFWLQCSQNFTFFSEECIRRITDMLSNLFALVITYVLNTSTSCINSSFSMNAYAMHDLNDHDALAISTCLNT